MRCGCGAAAHAFKHGWRCCPALYKINLLIKFTFWLVPTAKTKYTHKKAHNLNASVNKNKNVHVLVHFGFGLILTRIKFCFVAVWEIDDNFTTLSLRIVFLFCLWFAWRKMNIHHRPQQRSHPSCNQIYTSFSLSPLFFCCAVFPHFYLLLFVLVHFLMFAV